MRGQGLPRAKVRTLVAIVGAIAAGALFAAPHDHPQPVVLAPGYSALTYAAPIPGTYDLPVLGKAGNGMVLDASGRPRELHQLLKGKISVLGFIYTSCNDVNGCPLATFVMSGVQRAVLADPALAKRVQLVSFSFDPDNDTPAALNQYAAHFRSAGSDWTFLTCADRANLDPILEQYDQWVIRDVDEAGNILGTISHVLRVYLIDESLDVRNIYSTAFLHADTLMADIATLANNQ